MKLDYSDLRPKPDKNWREKATFFFKIKPLTKEDLKEGRNGVEKITVEEVFGKRLALTFRFGKYYGKPYVWVKENDAAYFQWCIDNVNGFDPTC